MIYFLTILYKSEIFKCSEHFPLNMKEYGLENKRIQTCKEIYNNTSQQNGRCNFKHCWGKFDDRCYCTPGFAEENCEYFINPSSTLTVEIEVYLPFSAEIVSKIYKPSTFLITYTKVGLRSILGNWVAWNYYIERSVQILDFRYKVLGFINY